MTDPRRAVLAQVEAIVRERVGPGFEPSPEWTPELVARFSDLLEALEGVAGIEAPSLYAVEALEAATDALVGAWDDAAGRPRTDWTSRRRRFFREHPRFGRTVPEEVEW